MRLICPRCGAQYEIDAAAIPAAGRDVECSACDHVWRAWPVSEPAEPFDPTARPRLSRPLSESVIEILRQEAARELEVRAAERRAQRLADAGEVEAGVDEAGVAEAGKAEAPFPDAAAALAAGAVAPSPDDTLLPGDAPEVQSGGTDDARAPTTAAPTAKQSAVSSAAAPVAAIPAAMQSAPLAAVTPVAQPPTVPVPAARPQPASAWAAAPPAPAQAVSRRRYDAGFHLAVMLALVALALYALAPRLGDQQPLGPVLLEWRGKVDQGRDWFSAKGDAAIAGLRAVIDGQGAAD
ncbi:MJ0042 family finger-like domain-containing protein [Paracoccus solventivorans]|uniref:MJ0042 family finger-like domain-containing protein n=1 Tax=Paracoccus solventivorans TaxID=53463 RepID=A0A1M7HN04_9RHOB|nr:zinc-ribbon domain-containing protein [Paracoccus solventivorans]SHM29820.1 MJ0042 family finger-like domain-containing protein [Paracoccus solventivorans]